MAGSGLTYAYLPRKRTPLLPEQCLGQILCQDICVLGMGNLLTSAPCWPQVMTQAGGDVKEEVWRAFIVLLTNAPELHAYAARSLFRSLREHLASAELSLLATATWYIGARTAVFAGRLKAVARDMIIRQYSMVDTLACILLALD